jgi:LuxR family maltose regulon positive regulatory protein
MPSEQLVLQTKIQVPQLRGKILARRRILNPLLANRDKKLITVCADAGYGKSTLLAQFCAELDEAFVYYTLDQSDNDLATFVNYILEGMQRSFPGFGDRTRQAARQTPYVNIVMGTLINEFVQNIPDDFYLILDDHHYLAQNLEIARAVEYLVKHAPAKLHLIIASRATASLSLTHYLAKQELYQVDRNALRFTLKEIQELLKESYSLKVPDADIARIERHTEGWITGIQLILQKIRDAGGEKASETLNGYLSSGEELFNYFAEEVFEHQPREIQDFLIKTSILELLNLEIVNYLLKIRKAGDFFQYLETGHIFTTRVGDGFRYHPIFKEFLTKKLIGYYPQKVVRALNNNLGDYFRAKRDFSAAVNHYLVAENYAQAAKVIEKNYHYWRAIGNFSAFIALVRRFPESITDRFPHLLLLAAKYYLYLGKNSEVLKITRKLVVRFGKERNYDSTAQVHYLNGYVHLLQMNQRQAIFYMKRAGRWAGKIKPKTRLEILIALGIIYRIYDRYPESEKNLAAALKLAKKMRDPDDEINVIKNYAYLYWAMSDYQRADRTFNELFQKYGEDKIPVDFGKLYTDAAFVALNNHNLEKSLYYLAGAEKIAEQYNDQRTLMYCFFYRADLYKYQGENRKAIANYERTLEMNREFSDRFLDFYSRLYLSNIYIRLGELSTARSLLDKVDIRLLPKDSPQINIDYCLVRSALEIAEGNFSEARTYLTRARTIAARIGNPFQRMAVDYAQARYFQKSGRGLEARECVDRVIADAVKYHYEVFLIDEGRWDLSLIEAGLRPGPDQNFLLNILEEISTDAARILLARQQIKKGIYDVAATFFGPLEIRSSRNKTITPHWRTKKGKALFMFLIVNRPHGCTRDQLIDAFWPGKDLHEAAHSLQVEISSLRALLSELSNTEMKNKEIINFKNQKYSLDQRFLVQTDVQEFDELVREAEVAANRYPHEMERIYLRALSLYRGDFGLDITDDWCENIRRSYRQTVIRILKKMGKYHLASGKYRTALEYYRRALLLDDYDEEIHIAIMRCAAALGDHRTLSSQYALLVRKLKDAGINNPPAEAVRLLRNRSS